MEIQHNSVVEMHYTLKDDEGEIIDSSEGEAPLVFLQGHGNIIHGLERALGGLKVGDTKDVVVEPGEGYGEYDDDLVQEVPRSAFEGIGDLEVGMKFHADTDDGLIPVTVVEIADDVITIDGNHELAGERLHFSVRVESIREATAEEIAHGHIHGDDDHHHHHHHHDDGDGCGCSHQH